jgi:hypothetical protein
MIRAKSSQNGYFSWHLIWSTRPSQSITKDSRLVIKKAALFIGGLHDD